MLKPQPPKHNKTPSTKSVSNKNQTAPVSVVSRQLFHSGPLPSPDVLEGYNKLKPGAADIIINMALRDQQVRHETIRSDNARKDLAVKGACDATMSQLKLAKVLLYTTLAFCGILMLSGLCMLLHQEKEIGLWLLIPGVVVILQHMYQNFFKNR